MPHVILSGRYGDARYGRGMLGAVAPTPTTVQPIAAPVTPLTKPSASPVTQMQQMFPPQPAPEAPPADAKVLAPGILLDLRGGNIWYNGARIAIVSAVLSAIVVKMVLFGGSKAGQMIRNGAGRFVAKKPDAA